MKYLTASILATFLLSLSACVTAQNAAPGKTYQTTGSIERLDPALDQLIAKDAKIEVLGLLRDTAHPNPWTEGPVWIKEGGGFLVFSEIPGNRVMKWSEKDGLSLYLHPAGYTGKAKRGGETGSNGLQIGPKGRLILCQHGDRRMAYMDAPLTQPQSKFVTITGKHNGKRFNSPNDSVFHKNGDLYFTDPLAEPVPTSVVQGTMLRPRPDTWRPTQLPREFSVHQIPWYWSARPEATARCSAKVRTTLRSRVESA
jgi:hypothetical protein